MLLSQKHSVRLSEIRQRLNELAGVETLTTDQRQESDKLQVEYKDKETQYRAAIVGEGRSRAKGAVHRARYRNARADRVEVKGEPGGLPEFPLWRAVM